MKYKKSQRDLYPKMFSHNCRFLEQGIIIASYLTSYVQYQRGK